MFDTVIQYQKDMQSVNRKAYGEFERQVLSPLNKQIRGLRAILPNCRFTYGDFFGAEETNLDLSFIVDECVMRAFEGLHDQRNSGDVNFAARHTMHVFIGEDLVATLAITRHASAGNKFIYTLDAYNHEERAKSYVEFESPKAETFVTYGRHAFIEEIDFASRDWESTTYVDSVIHDYKDKCLVLLSSTLRTREASHVVYWTNTRRFNGEYKNAMFVIKKNSANAKYISFAADLHSGFTLLHSDEDEDFVDEEKEMANA